jgi:UDP-N-acetylmuramate-alanine ligase
MREFGNRGAYFAESLSAGAEMLIGLAGKGDVIVTMGAGSVSQASEQILDRMRSGESPAPASV